MKEMKEFNQTTLSKIAISFEVVLISFGIYFIGRVIRTQLYIPLVELFFPSDSEANHVLIYFGHLIFLAFILIYIKLRPDNNPSFKEIMGKFSSKSMLLFIFGIISGLVTNGASILAAIIHKDIDMVWKGANPGLFILAIVAVFIQSSVEEIHYRGWVFNRLSKETSLICAVIFSAVNFSLAHCLNRGISLIALINIFTIGIIYALSSKLFGTIYYACSYHFAWNFSQNFIFGLPNSGTPAGTTLMAPTYTNSSLLYDADFGVEATLFTTVMNVVIIIIFLLILKHKEKGKGKNDTI